MSFKESPKRLVAIVFFLILGFLLRAFLIKYGNTGDVTAFAEWGEKFWQFGAKNFYFEKDWYYTFPTYPPIANLLYAGLYWLNERSYVLAQIHNAIKIIPASFIIFFGKAVPKDPLTYNFGYYLLLKLPSIIADLGISLLIYKVVFDITRSKNKAMAGFLIFLFNPVTIFVSAVWGQSESLVAFFGLLAFVLLSYQRTWASLPLFFASLFIKPTWAIFLPLYIFLLYLRKPKFSELVLGASLSFFLFLFTTIPFSGGEILEFSKTVLFENILPTAKGTARASVSAFNFHTIFLKIDRSLASDKLIFISAETLGILSYIFINLVTFGYLRKQRKLLFPSVVSLFVVGFGSFLFLANMLERYFFSGFAPLIIIALVEAKTIVYSLGINLIVFANLIWAFYRRGLDEIDHPFTSYNFLLIRIISAGLVVNWYLIARTAEVFASFRSKLKMLTSRAKI